MKDQKIALPEKCCAKCGFLYGITQYALGNLGTFDPDLVRSASFDEEHPKHELRDKEPIKVTSYSLRQFSETTTYREAPRTITLSSIPTSQTVRDSEFTEMKMVPVNWHEVDSYNCFWKVFASYKVDLSSNNIEDFLTLAREDRSDCEKYYEYHPGFTAKEHAEIRLQEKREAVLDEYWERDNFRELVLGVITIVFAISTIILAYLYGAK